MEAVFLESAAKPLIVLHALLAAALLGSVTHAAVEVVGYLRGSPRRPALERLHTRLSLWLYGALVLVGALVYPAYRVRVRHEVFDVSAPWASNLFDIKETYAALGLGLAVAAWVLSRRERPAQERGASLGLYAFCSLGVAATVWFASISGLYLSLLEAP